ncbi:FG-GAP and VCBS repeat-containing protein [Streptomyces chilikensis]|uniref:FG-GAP and VCBS repeat-containing protein n=1 Tax=Streptomyces chilikensis TaxID=1194079 RepID=UPI0014079D8B|nr:FG-GAP and VCBS repeat-containing protein [Streptomyces chilikensis]
MRPTRTAALAAVLTAALTGPLFLAAPVPAAPARLADDFNGDGYRDLVLAGGTYGEDGRVTVVYGTSAGPGTRVQTIHQNSAGIPGAVEAGDHWGTSTTTADLDRDGYADLVVASPGEKVGDVELAGGLTVVWGGSGGLGPGTVFHSPVPQEYPGSGDSFGEQVVTGDFDGDGDADLAAYSNSRAGVVLLEGPFTRAGGHGGHQSLGGGYGYLNSWRLAAGQVDGGGATDLYVLGLDLTASDIDLRAFYHRGGSGFATRAATVAVPEATPDTGPGPLSAAIGDFDKDGHGDLAVGRGGENPDLNRGYVVVQYGGASGPDTARRPVKFTQDTAGVPGAVEDEDLFGSAVAAGDVNGDGYADLAVGAPGEDLADKRDGGAVTVLLGRAGGLSGTGAKAYDQNTSGVAGSIEVDDNFGRTLRLTDHTGDGRADLMVGTDDWVGGTLGMAHLLKGSATGITGTGSTSFTVASLGLPYGDLGTWFSD